MRPERGLLDTSVAIALTSLDPERLPEEVTISTLTLAELGAGPFAQGQRRQCRRPDDRGDRPCPRAGALTLNAADLRRLDELIEIVDLS